MGLVEDNSLEAMQQLARSLKKNGISMNIVCFGEEDGGNIERLSSFIEIITQDRNRYSCFYNFLLGIGYTMYVYFRYNHTHINASIIIAI